MSRALKQLVTYPAADRNKGPILEVLKQFFKIDFSLQSQTLKALEIGSATGQHVAHFASEFPHIQFQPTDVDSSLFDNIVGFREQFGLSNICDPLVLDLNWPVDQWPLAEKNFDIIYCSNVLHISPWSCSVGLFAGAGHWIRPKTGLLVIYGPFAVDGLIEPQSNVDFNRSLLARDPQWGIRDTRSLNELAKQNGLALLRMVDMPANNKLLLFATA